MDLPRHFQNNEGAQWAQVDQEVIIARLFIALSLLALFAGCATNEPREMVRAGNSYQEEIKSPLPRQQLIDPTCIVR